MPGVERGSFRMQHLADQRLEIRRCRDAPRLGIADQPLRHPALVDARHSASAFTTCSRDTPTRSSPVISLKKARRSSRRQLADPLLQPCVALFLVERGKRQQPLVASSLIERNLVAARALRQQQRQRLGEIADCAIAFLAEPFGVARAFDRQAPQKPGRRCLARLAAARGNRRSRPRSPIARGSALAAAKNSTIAACLARVEVPESSLR